MQQVPTGLLSNSLHLLSVVLRSVLRAHAPNNGPYTLHALYMSVQALSRQYVPFFFITILWNPTILEFVIVLCQSMTHASPVHVKRPLLNSD